MKKRLFFILVLAAISVNAMAQLAVPNGSFENWNNFAGFSDPVDWATSNYYIYSLGGPPDVTQVSPGYDGNYAAQIQTVKFTYGGAADSSSGSMSPINPVKGNGPFVVTQSPGSFTGYYKFQSGSGPIKDSALITINIYDTSGAVGYGAVILPSKTVSAFTQFTIPISYFSTYSSVDSVLIEIDNGINDVVGTTLIIDALSLTAEVTAVQAAANPSGIVLYPNPATDAVSITNLPASAAQITITDFTGKTVKTIPASSNLVNVTLGGVAAGLYFYSVTDNSGTLLYSDKFAVTK